MNAIYEKSLLYIEFSSSRDGYTWISANVEVRLFMSTDHLVFTRQTQPLHHMARPGWAGGKLGSEALATELDPTMALLAKTRRPWGTCLVCLFQIPRFWHVTVNQPRAYLGAPPRTTSLPQSSSTKYTPLRRTLGYPSQVRTLPYWYTDTQPQLAVSHALSFPVQETKENRMADRPHRGGHGGPRGARGGGRGGGRGGAAAAAQGQQGQDKERPKKENILDLKKYMDKRITVKFNGGREGWSQTPTRALWKVS